MRGLTAWVAALVLWGGPALAQARRPIIEVRGPGVVVEAAREADRPTAERIAALYRELAGVSRLRLGRAPEGEVRVTLVRLAGEGGGFEGTVGLATWSSGWIRIDPDRLSPTASLPAVLAHEVTHLVVGQAAQGQVPTWFDEGVAEWMGATWGIVDRRALSEAAAAGRLPTLASLADGFPSDPEGRRVAYGASRQAVELMAAEAPAGAIAATLHAMAAGRPFAEALTRATGYGPEHWDARLAAEFAPGPSLLWRMLVADPGLIWWFLLGLGGLLAIYGAVVRTRRARRRLEAAEPEVETDPDDAMTAHYAEHGLYEPEGDWEPDEDPDAWKQGAG